MSLLLDGPRGNRIRLAPREQVKPIVADIFEGEAWSEELLDEILRQMDSNIGPPILGVRSLVGATTPPVAYAFPAPVVDPRLRYFQNAERNYVTRHSRRETPVALC